MDNDKNNKNKDPLEDKVPSYGVEALVSTIDDRKELIAALKAASERYEILRRQSATLQVKQRTA